MKYAQAILVALVSAIVTSGWWAIGTGLVFGRDFAPAIVLPTVAGSIFLAGGFLFATFDNWNK